MKEGYRFCPLCAAGLTKKQHEGRERSVCPACGWVWYSNPLPVSVAAVLDKEGKILVIRRKIRPGTGKWALPGGFIEEGESPEEGCLRELYEETGLSGIVTRFIGVFHQWSRLYGSILVMACEVRSTGGELRFNEEVGAVRFITADTIPPIAFASHKIIIKSILSTP